ncbi:MAG: DUF7533 family protein [Halobacteriota archaeon]
MKFGVIEMLSLAATLIFAIPVANFGVLRLLAGDTALGTGMIVVAVAMVVIPLYVLDPRTIAKRLLRGLLPRRLRTDAERNPDRPETERE